MKLLQIMAGAEFGGAEIFFSRLVVALKKTKIQQHIIMRAHEERKTLFEDQQIAHTLAPFGGWIDFKTKSLIKKTIKTFNPDIVMTWMSRASQICPRGSYVHVARLGGYYDLKYYRKADHLIGNTVDIVDYFKRSGWSGDFTAYLPNFVPVASQGPALSRKEFSTPEGVPLLLSLGRFHDDKAFDILIPALSRIPQAYLWLGGEGEEEESLKNLARKEGVLDRIRFLGWRRETSPLFKACDIYICPSRIEPLGNVVLEAWAHQKPVVAAASLGPKGLIQEGYNGLLAEIDDIEGLAQQIRRAIEDEDLKQTLAENGHKTFTENFSEDSVVKQYIQFLEAVKGKKRST
jgi:glycosyltransferase involved in cell wall biosynthesis